MALTIQQMSDLMLTVGLKNDPRPKKEIDRMLKELKETYKSMDKKKKKYFDEDRLTNPYGDSRVLYGEPKRKIKSVLACIDADVSEVLLVDRLREKGQDIDMVIAHHPEGRALIDLTRVMPVQDEIMASHGVPVNVAEKLLASRMTDLDRALHPANFYRPADAARLLDVPFMCCHTPADNSVHTFIDSFIKKRQSKLLYVKDLMEAWLDIEEFQEAEKMGMGPMVFAGSPKSKLGKIAVTGMTGGTSGNKEIFKHLAAAGVGTIISMHMSEDPRKIAEKHHLNVIITGHMASDSIGLNLVMDHFEAKGVKIIPAGGFIRVKRKV